MELQFLIIEPRAQIRGLLKKNFEEQFDAKVLALPSSSEAINILDKGSNFTAIITRNSDGEISLANGILNYLYDHQLSIPLIVIGEFEHALKRYVVVSDKLRIEEVNRVLLKVLNLKKESFKHLKLPNYLSYPIHYFYEMSIAPCDVYIRLNKKNGEEYIKRFNESEEFTKADIKKYEESGLEEFYISKDDNIAFMNALLVQTMIKVQDSKDEKVNEVLSNTFSISTDMMKKLGITPEAKALADTTIGEICQQISKTNQLGILLRRILDDTLSFSYRRSYLISLIAASIMPNMEWGGASKKTEMISKIVMVSFFHDIYLEDDKLLKIMSLEELRAAENSLTTEEKHLIVGHAHKAAFLLQSYPKLPSGVDLIVKQHHGTSNGVGFPEKYSISISPLSILFVVLEEFAHQLLTAKEMNVNLILKKMNEKFSQPAYNKIVIEIQNLIKAPKK